MIESLKYFFDFFNWRIKALPTCPHTPQYEHTFTPDDSSSDIHQCNECQGLIKYCQHCEQANRLTARHCVQCGHLLSIPTSVPSKLLRPGEIRQAVQAPSHYPLNNSLNLPNNHDPFMWFSVEEGLLVLTQNKTSQEYPLALHFIPSYLFNSNNSTLITEDCPPYQTWIQQPLVSQQGFFIATENKLQYFPTHGYENIFEPQSWQPPSGFQILAIALDKDGQPLILVSDNDDHKMQLFLGNIQSGQWGKTKIDLNKTANNSGYSIAVGKAVPELCAIYDGSELLLVNLRTASVQQQVTLNDGLRPVRLFYERARTAYFEPFLIGNTGDSPRCIIPVNSRNDEKPRQAGVVRFGNNNPNPTKTEQFKLDSWILPDPWGLGFMIWSEQAVQRYEGHQPSWNEAGSNFSQVQPLQTPHWFVGQASSSRGRQENTEILIISATKENDRYNLTLSSQQILQNVNGTKVAGMPPIQSNGRLFIALRGTNNGTNSVIVYTMQIA